jgi:hypothetical protein
MIGNPNIAVLFLQGFDRTWTITIKTDRKNNSTHSSASDRETSAHA